MNFKLSVTKVLPFEQQQKAVRYWIERHSFPCQVHGRILAVVSCEWEKERSWTNTEKGQPDKRRSVPQSPRCLGDTASSSSNRRRGCLYTIIQREIWKTSRRISLWRWFENTRRKYRPASWRAKRVYTKRTNPRGLRKQWTSQKRHDTQRTTQERLCKQRTNQEGFCKDGTGQWWLWKRRTSRRRRC